MELSVFADEVSATLPHALAVIGSHGIGRVDVRSVNGTGVLDLSDTELAELRAALDGENMTVASVATGIGKVAVTALPTEAARFTRALEIADRLSASHIRVFSWYAPEDCWDAPQRTAHAAEIAAALADFDRRGQQAGVTVVVENERNTFADSPQRMLDVLQQVGSPTLRTAYDPANYVHCGHDPYTEVFGKLRTWLGCLHVKDVDAAGVHTVAGAGVCRWPEILADLARDPVPCYLSLEPHLARAGAAGGFTGPDKFRDAVVALNSLLPDADPPGPTTRKDVLS